MRVYVNYINYILNKDKLINHLPIKIKIIYFKVLNLYILHSEHWTFHHIMNNEHKNAIYYKDYKFKI